MKPKRYTLSATRHLFLPSEQDEAGLLKWAAINSKGKREYLPGIDPDCSALLVVDLQVLTVEWGSIYKKADPVLGELYENTMKNKVIPNAVRLCDFFRSKNMPVVFVCMGYEDPVPQLKRRDDEVILYKCSSGAFATCGIDNLLKDLGVSCIFTLGADSAGCVEGTVSGLFDHTYVPILIDDASVSQNPILHDASMKIWGYKGFVRSTDQVINDYPWQSWIDPDLR